MLGLMGLALLSDGATPIDLNLTEFDKFRTHTNSLQSSNFWSVSCVHRDPKIDSSGIMHFNLKTENSELGL
jgi:hypothetical protein